MQSFAHELRIASRCGRFWLSRGAPMAAIMPRCRRASPQPLGSLAIVQEQPGYLRIAAAREFSGYPRDFPRGSTPSCAEKCGAQAQTEYETGTPGINSVRADLSGASARKSSRTRIRDWPVRPARHRRFSALRRLCKSLDSLSFMGRSPWFRLSHNSTHPSAKELVFFVSRLGVTTHERTELRLWRGLP